MRLARPTAMTPTSGWAARFLRRCTIRILGAGMALIGAALPAASFEIEEHVLYPASPERSVLRVISTADRDAFEPVIAAWQQSVPGVTVSYTIATTTEVMKAIEQEGAVFDLVISSAMDLQTKLANDGFARRYAGADKRGLPGWASWRDQVFGFTQEPAVLVISDAHFPRDLDLRTRDDLVAILRATPERFHGRVATYDIRSSGVGYLMATQDSRSSEAYWRLMEVMGRLDAQLYCCSGDMIRDVASGKLALAYNVLGSYARAQQKQVEGFRIIRFEDYVNVMLRTALIPQGAENPRDAERFIDFLIQLGGRPDIVARSGLPAIDITAFETNSALRPIRFGPGLLVYLDQLRRTNFLKSWESSLLQETWRAPRQ